MSVVTNSTLAKKSLVNFFKKFWIQSKIENTLEEFPLPKTDLVDYNYMSKETRVSTVSIYNNDYDTLRLIASDDGTGMLIPTESGMFSSATGAYSTVDYVNSTITINWDASYLASLTNPPLLKAKYISETLENHVELLDFLGEVFQYYKENELDARLNYYNPEEIPLNVIEQMARDHNWVIDKFFSEDEDYLRRQLKYLYDLYRSKRKVDSVSFIISIINRRVNLYNLLAKKDNYSDYSEYVLFDTKTLMDTFDNATPGPDQELIADQIQAIYDSLYTPTSDYYPTKHFLLDLALDIMTTDGYLLNDIDLPTLKNYILRVKSKTQYPHLQSYLGIYADASYRHQNSSVFTFKLTEAEQTYSITPWRDLFSGPYPVESVAQYGEGAWVSLPMIMNNTYIMNSGLIFNMQIGDIGAYLTSFRIGTGVYETIDPYLDGLKQEFYTSSNMTIIYDTEYYYLTLTLDEDEGTEYPIREVGIYSNTNKLAFYIKHPDVYKTDIHKHVYRLKLKVSGFIS